MESAFERNRTIITIIIYFTLLLDNVLLTIIVPILPDFLQTINEKSNSKINVPSVVIYKSFDLHYIPSTLLKNDFNISKTVPTNFSTGHKFDFEAENGRVGVLLAIKAFVQLLTNPFIGNLSGKFGYKIFIFVGTLNLILSALSE